MLAACQAFYPSYWVLTATLGGRIIITVSEGQGLSNLHLGHTVGKCSSWDSNLSPTKAVCITKRVNDPGLWLLARPAWNLASLLASTSSERRGGPAQGKRDYRLRIHLASLPAGRPGVGSRVLRGSSPRAGLSKGTEMGTSSLLLSLSNSSPHAYARSPALTCDVQLGALTSGLGGSVLGQPPPWPGSRPPAPRGSRH